MSIKAFTSLLKAATTAYNSTLVQLEQVYATIQHLGAGKVGLHTAPRWLASVSTGNTIDAAGSTKRVLAIAAHGHRKYDIIRFTSGVNTGEEVQIMSVDDANAVLLGQELPNTPGASDAYTLLRSMTPTLNSSGQAIVVLSAAGAGQTVVDFLDTPSMVPTGGNVIPKRSDPPLEVVNSLAADVSKIQVIADVGEFINLYRDAAGATLIAHLPLTPDGEVTVSLSAGDTIYLGASKDVDIDSPTSIISINFIG